MSSDPHSSPWNNPEFSERRAVDQLCRAFEDQWRMGQPPSIESIVSSAPQSLRSALLPELIAVEWEWRARSGNVPTQDEYRSRFPEHESLLIQLATDPGESSSSCSLTHPSVSFKAGDEFAGYRILRKLGAGGMGTVFLAEISAISHPVALKILQPSQERGGPMAARFEREARLLSRLDHPGIVPLYSYGEEDGRRFLAMKAIDGVSLADLIFANEPAGTVGGILRNPNSPERLQHIKSIAIQLTETLQFVHQAGILHRDIKPSNILLMDSGKVFLSDFGLARGDLIDSDLTSQHEFIGTLRYAAPESLDGVWTVQTDLYSLGLVLLELYSLNPSFPAKTRRDLLHQKLDARSLQKTVAASTIPVSLRRIVEKLTMFNPEQRYKSAADALTDLKKLDFQEPPKLHRFNWPFVASIAVALTLLGVAVFWNQRNQSFTESDLSAIHDVAQTDSQDKQTTPTTIDTAESSVSLRIRDTHVVPLNLRDRANLLTISDSGNDVLLSAAGQLLRWDTRYVSAYPIQDRPGGRVLAADISPSGDIVFCAEEPKTDPSGGTQSREKTYGMASSMPEEAEKWFGFGIPSYDTSFCVPKFVRGGSATPRCTVPVPSSTQPAIHNLLLSNVQILPINGRRLKMLAVWEQSLAVISTDDMWMLTSLDAPDFEAATYPAEISNPTTFQFVNDGQNLLVSNSDEFSLFAVATRQKVTVQKVPPGTQPVLSTLHLGPWIAFTDQHVVHVFDIAVNKWLPETIKTTDNILLAATIAEEKTIITVEESGRIRLTQLQPSGTRLVDELKTRSLTLSAYAVHGRRLAAIDGDANLRVFQIEP